MDQHLTVREARAFTGKSESTLKRLIREVTGNSNHPDRTQILPPPEEVERRKKVGDVFVWKINQDFLLRRFPKTTDGEGSGPSHERPITESHDANAEVIIQVLRDQLVSKDRQLQTLETQLDRKDEQIKSLNDRMHETNTLMRELQVRLAIAPPARSHSTDAAVVAGDSNTKAKSSPTKQPAPKKRRSLVDRLLGRK